MKYTVSMVGLAGAGQQLHLITHINETFKRQFNSILTTILMAHHEAFVPIEFLVNNSSSGG